MAFAAQNWLRFPDTAVTISVTFWGTRGSVPIPGPATTRYGGNTACVSIRDTAGHHVVLDAGTGIRALGQALVQEEAARLDLFLSHVHWDHIQGLPFFLPMFREGQEICIYGPRPAGHSLATVLDRQFEPAVYPVPSAARAARLTVEEVRAGMVVTVPGFRVETCLLSHPGGALGYRVTPSGGGPTVAYLTDNELGAGGAARVPTTWRQDLSRFISGVDVLIHDGMYTPAVAEARPGWGHSSTIEAVDLAGECSVRHLVLFHHDPDHDDAQVAGLLALAAAAAPDGLTVSAASEGWTLEL